MSMLSGQQSARGTLKATIALAGGSNARQRCRWIAATVLLVLSACTSVQRTDEYLDEHSGNTIAVVTKPLLFARERTDVAAYARDYATLVAVEGDNAGKFTQYLLLYRWSTVDSRMSPPPPPDAGELRIQGEGRVIDLKPLESFPFDLSSGEQLHIPDNATLVAHAYVVDVATLKFIAESRVLSVVMPQEALATPFVLWKDGRPALEAFVQRAAGS